MCAHYVRPAKAGLFLSPDSRLVMDASDITRAVRRMSHEIIERNKGVEDLVITGIEHGGVWLAELLVVELRTISHREVPIAALNVRRFRDDVIHEQNESTLSGESIRHEGRVVLVDDVLFTGRTVRAALDALTERGRPSQVQLAVLIDRGHRELPIRADFVGKNLPTSKSEVVVASSDGVRIAMVDHE